MAVISRLQLDHPALGTAGGAALHASVQAMYQKIGDNMGDRLFFIENLADAGTVDADHNFNTALGNLRWDLYEWNTGTGVLTLLTADTTPAKSDFGVAAKGGAEETEVVVTNNSGAERDLVLVMFQDPIELDELTDVDLSTTAPADGQVMKYELSSKKWKPGPAGGGGGSIVWNPPAGSAPLEDEVAGEKVYLFENNVSQKLIAFMRVPSSFVAGSQITSLIGIFSPSTSNNIKIKSTTYLIRPDTDAVDSTTNSHASTNSEITAASPSKELRNVTLDLTDGSGEINSVAVSAGDLIRVELERDWTNETASDTADTRFIPTATEPSFA